MIYEIFYSQINGVATHKVTDGSFAVALAAGVGVTGYMIAMYLLLGLAQCLVILLKDFPEVNQSGDCRGAASWRQIVSDSILITRLFQE
ncbi:MAG TPA: hypothetical protein VHJ19_02105 [Gammaproteobacteria bacterium]|nr:hypothetical protein [Gammaproteobacteria bacterium]